MASVARQDIPLFNASNILDEKEFLNSFERDIEDAIFEAVETDEQNRDYQMFHARKELKAVHISQVREQLISNQNDPSQRLSVFSRVNNEKPRKPVLSQIILALAICSISIALLFPALWLISSQMDNLTVVPDETIFTGSISPADVLPETESLKEDPVKSAILDMPNTDKPVNEGHVVRIDRGLSAGSIIYVNPN